jgi:hypothetical protein
LVSLLIPLTDGTSPNGRTPCTFLTDGTHDELPVEIQQIVLLAADVLILNSRRANPDRCEELRRLTDGRCRVGPDETDSFGWLSAVLYTPGGQVVFG